MKIISYNVNGIRSAINKGFAEFLRAEDPDIICLQEIKANIEDIDENLFMALGYHCYWLPAQKKGYSGVAILSKKPAKNIIKGIGHDMFDFEGRIIQADFDELSVISSYFPSGTTGDIRQAIKYEFLDFFYSYIEKQRLLHPKLVICGDYNICHQPIDIHDPVSNKNSSGFLPAERAWMDKWFAAGFLDTFRMLNPQPHCYTWWSFRTDARARNKGWRIDYISATDNLKDHIKESGILSTYVHSDHCGSFVKLALDA
jgi:exodeoxyribonuclease-3